MDQYANQFLFTGTGYCIWSVCAMVAVQLFFDRRRGFATAFVTVGTSAGVLLWSWLTPFTIEIYTFKGALMIQSAVSLHGLIIAAILHRPDFQPIHPAHETRDQTEIEVDKYNDKCSRDEAVNDRIDLNSESHEIRNMSMHSGNKRGRPPSTSETLHSSESQKHLKRKIKFSDILDFSLLCKVPKITLFYISIFLIMFGDQVPYVFLPVRLTETKRSKDDASMLVMVLGITTVISRVLCGCAADIVNRDVMYAVSSLANGLASASFAFVTNFGALIAYCISFSVATGK